MEQLKAFKEECTAWFLQECSGYVEGRPRLSMSFSQVAWTQGVNKDKVIGPCVAASYQIMKLYAAYL